MKIKGKKESERENRKNDRKGRKREMWTFQFSNVLSKPTVTEHDRQTFLLDVDIIPTRSVRERVKDIICPSSVPRNFPPLSILLPSHSLSHLSFSIPISDSFPLILIDNINHGTERPLGLWW